MMDINEKDERRELLDAVADAGRLARGLDPLDIEGILALRLISERCAERILEAQNEVFCAEERGNDLGSAED